MPPTASGRCDAVTWLRPGRCPHPAEQGDDMNHLERLLAGSPNAADPAVQRFRAALAIRAQEHDLLDVAYRTIDTPVGQVLLAATPAGLVPVPYPRPPPDPAPPALPSPI